MKKNEALALMRNAMKIRNLSFNTIKSYGAMAERFMTYCVTAGPGLEPAAYVNKYVLLLQAMKMAPITINLNLAAIRFLFSNVFKKPLPVGDVPSLKEPATLPKVFSQDEMRRIFAVKKNPKHQLMLMLCFGCGLRVSELVQVKVGDFELDRGLLKVVHGKGDKERYVPISAIPAGLLQAQMHGKAGGDYLFNRQGDTVHLSRRTAALILDHACQKAGITHKHNIHMLRHSFATASLEKGTDVRKIQKMLGHSRVTTTEIYAFVSKEHLAGISGPLADVI
jgi:site-specific recombinase XerD